MSLGEGHLMKYSGHILDFFNEKQARYEVSEAVLSDSKLSIDWTEGDLECHLDATSDDGFTFRGSFGAPRPDAGWGLEVEKYTGRQQVLLFGRWWRDDGERGYWAFLLSPMV